jgi:hypothetical protein
MSSRAALESLDFIFAPKRTCALFVDSLLQEVGAFGQAGPRGVGYIEPNSVVASATESLNW